MSLRCRSRRGGKGKGGRETKGEGSWEREGRKEMPLSLPLSRFSFLFRTYAPINVKPAGGGEAGHGVGI